MLLDPHGRPVAAQRDTDVRDIQRIFAKELGARFSSHHHFAGNVWIYAIVQAVSSAIGEMPFGLWRPAGGTKAGRFSSKTWVPVTNEPLEAKLQRPNPWQDWRRFIEQWTTFLLMGGNVWMYIDEPTSTNVPRSFLLFGSDTVQPVRRTYREPPTAWAIYRPGESPVAVPLERMIHWGMINDYDQWMGMPPWLSMDIQLDADAARVLFDRSFFRNNATPDLVITHKPGPISRASRELIEEAWYASYGGEDKHGGVAVVGGDIDVKVLGIGHAQAEYIASRKFTRQEAAACYNYPVQLLNDIEGGGLGRDQLSVARTMKYENAVFPHANRFAEKFTEEYIKPYVRNGQNLIAAFNFDVLPVMIDFLSEKVKILTQLTTAGVPLNAALAMLDMGIDPVKGGDYPYIPSTQVPLRETPPEPAPLPAPGAPALAPGGEKPALPAPKDKSKTPKPAPKTKGLDEWAALDSLAYRAIRSVKRVYIDAQHEGFKHLEEHEPFNLHHATERWRTRLEPFLVGAFLVGAEHAEGKRAWTEECEEADFDTLVSHLKASCIMHPDVLSAIRDLNLKSYYALETLFSRLMDLTPMARERAIQQDIEDESAFDNTTTSIMEAMVNAYSRGIQWASPSGTAPTLVKITYAPAEATT